MEKALSELSTGELEELIERTIDRRLNVWLTQLMDAFAGSQEEEGAVLRPEFAASLKRSLDQAGLGEGVDLDAFRKQIGR